MSQGEVVLIADDNQEHRQMLATLLQDWGYGTRLAADGEEAVAMCLGSKKSSPDLVLMDVRMPKKDGLAAFEEIHARRPDLPVLIMTAYSELPQALDALHKGAYDYLTKPIDFPRLQSDLRNALAQKRAGTTHKAQADGHLKYEIIGSSPPMLSLVSLIETVAPSEANILISGESGTGKELVARAIHAASKRAQGPFVAVNCGALTESVLASELFGHEKGAFTGADRKHRGLFLEASGGTLFLDEIGEIPLGMQVKFLRALQEKEVLSVGGNKPEKTNCRIIAATNRDLQAEISRGNFREDLYYRLNVVSATLPPLRERKEDIPLLATAFAERMARDNNKSFADITPEAMHILCAYQWPGNVRELENVMERAIILMPGENIGLREIPERIMEECRAAFGRDDSVMAENDKSAQGEAAAFEDMTLEEVERAVILRTLQKVNYNKTEAARLLGITRKTLHARLNKYRREEGGESEGGEDA